MEKQPIPNKPDSKKASPVGPKTGGKNQAKGFPIVALGASAGGLEAFETFFKEMRHDSDIAFVLVAHLDLTMGTRTIFGCPGSSSVTWTDLRKIVFKFSPLGMQ